jgi:hypothetical protein
MDRPLAWEPDAVSFESASTRRKTTSRNGGLDELGSLSYGWLVSDQRADACGITHFSLIQLHDPWIVLGGRQPGPN